MTSHPDDVAGEIQLEDESLGRRSTGERGKWRSERRINTSKSIIMDKSIQFKSNENSSTMEMKNFHEGPVNGEEF